MSDPFLGLTMLILIVIVISMGLGMLRPARRRLASARQRSAHWLMREAIEQYVEREEQRQQMRQDALSAWEEYQETGLHVTAAEADTWLSKLEAGEDVGPPACHN